MAEAVVLSAVKLDEAKVTRLIVEESLKALSDLAELDVAVVGAGPAGLTVAMELARRGFKVAVFERRLSFGGGMGGGGMQLPRLVVEEEAWSLLAKLGCRALRSEGGLVVADSAEVLARLAAAAVDAGAHVLLGASVEDVVFREGPLRVEGVVVQWTSVLMAGLHVDPLAVRSRVVIDATGHAAEVCGIVVRKMGAVLRTRSGRIVGERPMWAERGEREILEATSEVYPGLIVAGMAANAVLGCPRMGAIFGGMLLSGRKAAQIAVGLLEEGVR